MPRRAARRPKLTWLRALVAVVALALSALLIRTLLLPRAEHAPPKASATPYTPLARSETSNPSPVPSPRPTLASSAPVVSPTAPRAHARLAIIIDDCGQWLHTEEAMIALPIPLTLAVLPEVRYTTRIADEAHAAGKEVMLHLPMQPMAALDPGPGKITTSMSDESIQAQVARDIDDIPYARGANNHEGSRATSDPRVMTAVMKVMARRGFFFIDSRTIATTVAQSTAQRLGVANAARDVFLDDRNTLPAVEAQLKLAARLALLRGSAIAIGHPRPETLAALRALYPALERDGITFVLAGSLVSDR
ncbi:MAG TPA: divergent polysaccharide deacetylase family protein [Candidatus Dormibacteraeota bacterium]|nr:divergent polysaccharide deacetylase family protein [Candidatus Dormibacteraeota bacterium]